jgi:exoribonuclease-2
MEKHMTTLHTTSNNHLALLQAIAHRAMIERCLLPDFSAEVFAELSRLQAPYVKNDTPVDTEHQIRDMRELLWASIDNDDSFDLDQLTFAEAMPSGNVKILVAIADVDEVIKNDSAIDQHARHNTTSVYTAAEIFPMLPERISTDITSLNLNEERLAIVIEMEIGVDGSLEDSDIFRARVRNHAKLAYNSLAAWLEGHGEIPAAVPVIYGLEMNLRLQDKAAQRMKNLRHVHGALSLETIEAKPIFDGDQIRTLEIEEKNRAKEIIEDLMIAANGVTARFLSTRKFPSIRRVVRTPKRWERIVQIANEHGSRLPGNPDSKAL